MSSLENKTNDELKEMLMELKVPLRTKLTNRDMRIEALKLALKSKDDDIKSKIREIVERGVSRKSAKKEVSKKSTSYGDLLNEELDSLLRESKVPLFSKLKYKDLKIKGLELADRFEGDELRTKIEELIEKSPKKASDAKTSPKKASAKKASPKKTSPKKKSSYEDIRTKEELLDILRSNKVKGFTKLLNKEDIVKVVNHFKKYKDAKKTTEYISEIMDSAEPEEYEKFQEEYKELISFTDINEKVINKILKNIDVTKFSEEVDLPEYVAGPLLALVIVLAEKYLEKAGILAALREGNTVLIDEIKYLDDDLSFKGLPKATKKSDIIRGLEDAIDFNDLIKKITANRAYILRDMKVRSDAKNYILSKLGGIIELAKKNRVNTVSKLLKFIRDDLPAQVIVSEKYQLLE